MTENEERRHLASLHDETADAWGQFAERNAVTIESLLEALAPILLAATPATLSLRAALRDAVESARSVSAPLTA